MKQIEITPSRRLFLASALAAGTLVVSLKAPVFARTKGGEQIALNAWVKIGADNRATVIVSQAEMGQGVHTTLAAIIADEADLDWDLVSAVPSPVGQVYGNPRTGTQFTGNAESVRTFWPHLRKLGASVRELMRQAAAAEWGVQQDECQTQNSYVVHGVSKRRAAFVDLVQRASQLPVPSEPPLKTKDQWALLGRPLKRVDTKAKITGAPIYGIDVDIPGMVHAAVKHHPLGTVGEVQFNRQHILDQPGVIDALAISGGVMVVADRYWRAKTALDQLEVAEGPAPNPMVDSERLDALYQETLEGDAFMTSIDSGQARAKVQAAPPERRLSAEYRSAWQAHAPMEPMNCVAHVEPGRCRIWAPTQGQTMTVTRVAEALNIDPDTIEVTRTFLGGGFGRRLIADFAVEAALGSEKVGRPVKLIWSREEDMQHDHYRPGVLHRIEAALGDDGLPVAMDQKLVSPTILSAVIPVVPAIKWSYPDIDPSCLEGLTEESFRYGLPANRLDARILDVPIPTMVWRTTGYGPNVFALESFVDEMSHKANEDPLTYRRRLLERGKENDRALGVLDKLARHADWGTAKPGRAQGLAFSYCFGTYIGQVIELSVDDKNALDIHRVVSVVDAGVVLDPDISAANIEGGVAWGLSQALTSEITFKEGVVEQSNFHDFTVLALAEMPDVETHFVESSAEPGGMGEVGPVPTAAALTNALFAATGKRLRRLPLSRHGFHTRYRKQFV